MNTNPCTSLFVLRNHYTHLILSSRNNGVPNFAKDRFRQPSSLPWLVLCLALTVAPAFSGHPSVVTVASLTAQSSNQSPPRAEIFNTNPLVSTPHDRIVYLEGLTSVRLLRGNESSKHQTQIRQFELSLSGSQWAVRLIADTNQPNAITHTTFDGTNMYVIVPDASGQTKEGAFAQSGAAYPGRIKVFPFHMGPLWWAYCSTSVTGGTNCEVLDFMDRLGNGDHTRETVYLKFLNTNITTGRIGSGESFLYPSRLSTAHGAESTQPLAHLTPLGVTMTNGLSIATNYSVTLYHPVKVFGGTAQPYAEYTISVTTFRFETNVIAFVPSITKRALIVDYRRPNSGEYLADHWLTANERKATRRSPLEATPIVSTRRTVTRIVLLAILVLPPLYIISRLHKVRVNTNKS